MGWTKKLTIQYIKLTVKMFVLAEIKDTIRLPPTRFGLNMQEAISNELNKKLANKVMEHFIYL